MSNIVKTMLVVIPGGVLLLAGLLALGKLFLYLDSNCFFNPRLQGLRCNNNIRQIEPAKDYYAQENGLTNGSIVTWEQLEPYLKSKPECPAGGTYAINMVGQNATCSLGDPTAKGEKNWWHRIPD